jgi:phage-related protein
MAEDEVNIVIKATDEASKVIGGITGALGGLGKIALGGAIAGIGAIGAGLVIAIKDAADEQVVLTNMQKVIEGTGKASWISADQVEQMALALEKTTRFSHDATEAASGTLLKFTSIGKDIFPTAIQTTLDMAEAMGMDASSAAQTLGRALEVPGEGLLRLKTLGVSFTDAQQEQIKTMVAAGDTAGAQKIILDALATSYNGVAEAAGNTLSGKLTIIKHAFGSLAEDIGASLLPMLTDLVQKYLVPLIPVITKVAQNIATWLPGAISQVITWIKDNLMPVLQTFGEWFITKGWPAIQQFIGVILSQLIPGLQQLWTWIQQGVSIVLPLLTAAWDFLKEHMNIVLPILAAIAIAIILLSSPISIVIGAIVLLATAWANNWGGIRDFLTNTWNIIRTATQNFVNFISPFIQGFLTVIKEAWDTALGYIKLIVQLALDIIHGNWFKFGEDLRTLVDKIWSDIKLIFSTAWTDIKKIVSTLIEDVKNFFTKTDWGGVGRGIIDGIITGIRNAAVNLVNAAVDAARAALDAVKGFLHIKSPSQLFAEIGKNMMQGWAIGISGNAKIPAIASAGVASYITHQTSRVMNVYPTFINSNGQGVVNDLKFYAKQYGMA